MHHAIKWLYLVTLAAWIGSIIFFSFAVAPTIFKVLKPEDAAALQRRLFPKYYAVGILCAAVGIVCVGLLLADRVYGKWPGIASLLLLAAMGATDLWLRQSIVPRMTELREQRAARAVTADEPDANLDAEWKSFHGLSVRLNLAVLLCGLALLFLVVYSRVV
jgi:uncharacterized membrane protein